MTEQEANALIEQIQQEEGDRVSVQISHGNTSGNTVFTALDLTLARHLRRVRIVKVDQWPSVRTAWSLFS